MPAHHVPLSKAEDSLKLVELGFTARGLVIQGQVKEVLITQEEVKMPIKSKTKMSAEDLVGGQCCMNWERRKERKRSRNPHGEQPE